MNDENDAGTGVGSTTAGAAGMDKLAAAETTALNEDQKAAIVAEAIQNGEKVIEIDGHLFTRVLYHDLGRELGAEQSDEILDKTFDSAPAWDAEPEPATVQPSPMTDEQIKAAVEPKPLVTDPAFADAIIDESLKSGEPVFSSEPKMVPGGVRISDDANYALLTVAGPTGRAVTKMLTLGGQNDAASISKAFADALHESSFGPR